VLDKVIEEMKKPGKPYRDLESMKEFQVMGNMDYTTPLAKFKKAGVDVVSLGVGPADWAVILKTAEELDYHPHYVNAGTLLNVDEFVDLAGEKLAQGIAFNSPNPLFLKKKQVKPENLEMVRRILKRFKEKYGKEMTYFGGFDYGIGMTKVLLEFYKQAGTLDPDKVMEKVRNGTVSDFTGTWTMGGEKTWGAPVIKGSACEVGVVKGRDIVYGVEFPLPTIP
jgi:ABC-type branched-subunit amino acid transport system substrate-binding protein